MHDCAVRGAGALDDRGALGGGGVGMSLDAPVCDTAVRVVL